MAITETEPVASAELAAPASPWASGEEVVVGAQVLGTGDHKVVGRLWIGFSLLFGVAAWALLVLATLDAVPDLDLVPDDVAGRVLSGSQLAVALLFAVPLFVGVATYVTPLQVGARTVAFPRAAAAAFWCWLLGAVLLIVGYAVDGGVGGVRPSGVTLTYLALALVVAALLLAVVCVVTTVVALRTPGMSLDRVPFLSWSMLVAATMWLLALPVLLANLLLVYLDVHYGAPTDFGVADLQWPQLAWAFQPPQVFAYAIPVVGVVSEVVASASGVRQARRGVALAAIGAFGILTFGAWAQPAFNEAVPTEALAVGMGVAILLPTLALLGAWATTLRQGGVPSPHAGLLGALGAAVALLLAAVASAVATIGPLDLGETPFFGAATTTFVLGAVALGAISALHHWGPKVWGRMPQDNLGRLAATLALLGTLVAGLALAVNGFQARFEALADASDALTWIAAVGVAVVVLALLVLVLSLLARGPAAGDDPWGGQTLEWATSSPPPPGNVGELAVVTSPEPLLDARAADGGER